MKREIKFRAWDIASKIMWYDKTVEREGYQENLMLTMTGNIRTCQWTERGVTLHPFMQYELMQFTGLKDKNGKEIYESDRVFDPFAPKDERELFTVKYNSEIARFILDGEGDAEWDETDWQVYDNIYEQKPTKELAE